MDEYQNTHTQQEKGKKGIYKARLHLFKVSQKYKPTYRTGSVSVFTSLWRGVQREGLSKTQRSLSVTDTLIIWTVVVVSHWYIHTTKRIKLPTLFHVIQLISCQLHNHVALKKKIRETLYSYEMVDVH